jgi:2,3-bisphosphoglycerate-independent phosphoglycerate mutase
MDITFPLKPLVLIVLDGVGIAPTSQGNAVTKAHCRFLEGAWDAYPHTLLEASGEYVGLPHGIKGNSEVGHMNLGSGRVVFQELPRINKAISSGLFFNNPVLLQAFRFAHEHNSRLHAAVCFSDAGVHGTITHLETLLEMARYIGFTQPLIIHAFTDGRDSPPRSAGTFLNIVQSKIDTLGVGHIGSIIGRFYAMDRNNIWDRVSKAYHALTLGEAFVMRSWQEALHTAYTRGETDEFISPTVIQNDLLQDPRVRPHDAFILLNYRADRAIELTSAFIQPDFSAFQRKTVVEPLCFVGMTQYAKGIPQQVAFPTEDIALPFGRIISEAGKLQLRIAESEKFPHVTYFFNGGRNIKFPGEDRIEIPSPNVQTYDLKPEMSLPEVTQQLINRIALRTYDFLLVNFANGDMVGHTGVLSAGIRAMKEVDRSTEQIVSAVKSLGGATIITADHGNAEEMLNIQTGEVDTEHSINPVPFIFIPPKQATFSQTLRKGSLEDVSPTMLTLMGIHPPPEMKGKVLFE